MYRKAVDLNIERMAEDGDKYACTYIGWLYNYGNGVDQSYSRAMKWYREAAALGHACVEFNIGVMYRCGNGVDQNDSTAIEWCRQAA